MNPLTVPSVQVLTNRGIPVLVHRVEPDASGVRFTRVYESDALDAEPVLETRFVRFTTLAMAEIEEKYRRPDHWWVESVDERTGAVLRRRVNEGDEGAVNIDPMDEWEESLSTDPNLTLLDTYALLWETTRQEAGKLLVDDHVDEYATALAGAVLLANGGGADAVVRLLKQGVSSSKRLRAEVAAAAEKALTELEEAEAADDAPATPTPLSLPPEPSPQPSLSDGAESAETLTSSGA